MADNLKYYYMRLKEDYFDSEEQMVLESMPDGYLYSNILLKLYLKALKGNGRLVFADSIPYTPQMIAAITRHQIGTVEKALKIFSQMGLVEVLDNGTIYMQDMQNMVGKSSTEADRIRDYRRQIDAEKSGVQMYDISTPENRDKILDTKDKNLELKSYSTDSQKKEESIENTTTTTYSTNSKSHEPDFSGGGGGSLDAPRFSLEDYAVQHIPEMNHDALVELIAYVRVMPEDLLKYAIDMACEPGITKRWKYAKQIIARWNSSGIRTLEAAKANQERYEKDQAEKRAEKTICREGGKVWY